MCYLITHKDALSEVWILHQAVAITNREQEKKQKKKKTNRCTSPLTGSAFGKALSNDKDSK